MKRLRTICLWAAVCVVGFAAIIAICVLSYYMQIHCTGKLVYFNGDKCDIFDLSDGTKKKLTTAEYCAEYETTVFWTVDDGEISKIYCCSPEETVCLGDFPMNVHGRPVRVGDRLYFLGSEDRTGNSAILYGYQNGTWEKTWDAPCHRDSGIIVLDNQHLLLTEYRGLRGRLFVDGALIVLNLQTGETLMLCEGTLPCYDPQGQRVFFRMNDGGLGLYDLVQRCVLYPAHSPDGSLLTAPVYSYENSALFCYVETPEGYFRYYFYDVSRDKSVLIDLTYRQLHNYAGNWVSGTPDLWIK